MAQDMMYDPPSGWRYGFPKPYNPSNPLEPIEHTLQRDGYSDELIAQGMAKHCRFWRNENEDTAAQEHVEGAPLHMYGLHGEEDRLADDAVYKAAWRETQGGERYAGGKTGDESCWRLSDGSKITLKADRIEISDSGSFISTVFRGTNDNTPKDRGPYITTYTGRFYFDDPRPEDFEIEDIAHSLAMTRRYGGHGRREYTTAEHSVHIYRWLCAQNAAAETRLAGLLHDAPEALSGFGDAASPRKKLCLQIAEAEKLIWELAIAPKYVLPPWMPEEVHEADRRICADEMLQNLHEVDPNVGPPLGITLEFWDFERARAEFLRAFYNAQRMMDGRRPRDGAYMLVV